jgi:hypothetical protein
MLPRLLVCLLFIFTATRGESAVVLIGGRYIRVPTPTGFVRYDGKDSGIDRLQASFAPPSNRVLAAFGEPADLENVQNKSFPTLSRSFNVQSNGQFDQTTVSPEEFATVQLALREQFDLLKKNSASAMSEVENNASSALSQELDDAIKVKVGEVAPLGVFAETHDSICFSLLVKAQLTGGPLEDAIDPVTVVSGCVALVREHVVYLFANSAYEDKTDAEWTRQQIVGWRDAVLAYNAPGMPEDAVDPEEPQAGVRPWWRRSGTIAASLTSILGLGIWGLRRRRHNVIPV